jgi:hypothetical protein
MVRHVQITKFTRLCYWARKCVNVFGGQNCEPMGELVIQAMPQNDLWVKPMFGDGKPFAFVTSKSSRQGQARLSPDSHWLAYTTNETGSSQIVVQTFPQASDKGY